MTRLMLIALGAVTLASGSGCCRGWFIWPGHYPHNPSFSQCCEPPWKPDPFKERSDRAHRPFWGRGADRVVRQGEPCYYNSRGIGELLGDDCHCDSGHGAAHGHPAAGYGHAGLGGRRARGGAYGLAAPGMFVPVSPEGIPLQPAPDAMSAAQVAYPYYTTRGPRDFFLGYPPGTQPPSIGP